MHHYLGLMVAGLGLLFFVAGTAGLLRFPDLYTRLHAVTKADTLGLGLICIGTGIYWGEWLTAFKLLLIWLFMLAAGALLSHLIAAAALKHGVQPWEAE